MNNIKEWAIARADMNWDLWMALLTNEKKHADDNLVQPIYWLLMFQMDKDRVLKHWKKMTFNERVLAMEIAF